MSGLRIIAGKARGRKLRSVPGDATRPITDRVKENLFNILGADVNGSTWLDLFAGTGSVGIEALSRGADFVRFTDVQRQAIETIRSNLSHTGLQVGSQVLRKDAFHLIAEPADRAFDYIYIAPPQYKKLWKRALLVLDENPSWLNEDAWVIIQIHPVEDQAVSLKKLEEFDRRKYGSTLLLFYRQRSAANQLSDRL